MISSNHYSNPIPPRLLGDGLIASCNNTPLKTALVFRETGYSYQQLKETAQRFAIALKGAGIRKGDRIAIYMNNSWPGIVSIYGASFAGAVFLYINPQTRAGKLKYILEDSGAKVLITDAFLQSEYIQAAETLENLELIIYSNGSGKEIQEAPVKAEPFETFIANAAEQAVILNNAIPVDLASLIYTSGSTGFPKGVMMTHQSMVFATWSLIEYLRLTAEERIMLLLPLAFDYGLYLLLMSVSVGATLIVEQSFIFPASVYKQINLQKPTVFPGVPTIYAMMIATHKKEKLRFESITKITNTAAALPAEFIPPLKEIFPNALIFKMYGLTECKRVSYLEPELIDKKMASVGKAIPGTEVFLATPDGSEVKPGEPGILYVRGPHVMSGYWKKEELSRKMLKQGPHPWEQMLCTNDWFKIDDEGFLYFLGRTDDIIKTRGEKVSPLEIENVLYEIEGVKEVAVLGVPDEIMGETIVAFLVMHENFHPDIKQIKQKCVENLEIFMVPGRIEFLEQMPKSPNGKIDKKRLKEILNKSD
jgi:acyl-CoA synthetase (AMP-forming)/AMP-acid ligase II